ncbi:unnamed protein product [Camellia sinensis]
MVSSIIDIKNIAKEGHISGDLYDKFMVSRAAEERGEDADLEAGRAEESTMGRDENRWITADFNLCPTR